jgi:hypothetical protein
VRDSLLRQKKDRYFPTMKDFQKSKHHMNTLNHVAFPSGIWDVMNRCMVTDTVKAGSMYFLTGCSYAFDSLLYTQSLARAGECFQMFFGHFEYQEAAKAAVLAFALALCGYGSVMRGMVFLCGVGSNGKTQLIDSVHSVFGGITAKLEAKLFSTHGGAHPVSDKYIAGLGDDVKCARFLWMDDNPKNGCADLHNKRAKWNPDTMKKLGEPNGECGDFAWEAMFAAVFNQECTPYTGASEGMTGSGGRISALPLCGDARSAPSSNFEYVKSVIARSDKDAVHAFIAMLFESVRDLGNLNGRHVRDVLLGDEEEPGVCMRYTDAVLSVMNDKSEGASKKLHGIGGKLDVDEKLDGAVDVQAIKVLCDEIFECDGDSIDALYKTGNEVGSNLPLDVIVDALCPGYAGLYETVLVNIAAHMEMVKDEMKVVGGTKNTKRCCTVQQYGKYWCQGVYLKKHLFDVFKSGKYNKMSDRAALIQALSAAHATYKNNAMPAAAGPSSAAAAAGPSAAAGVADEEMEDEF